MFRENTTRKNIIYRVRDYKKDKEETVIQELVKRKKQQYPVARSDYRILSKYRAGQ